LAPVQRRSHLEDGAPSGATAGFDCREIDLPVENREVDTTTLDPEVLAALSRKLFANALVPCDSSSETVQANIRVDRIHTPGSDLFVVVDTRYLGGDLPHPRNERWVNRARVLELTYLKAF
jgi:hypothetical protein